LYKANLRHVLLCTQRVARELVAAGRRGSIINVIDEAKSVVPALGRLLVERAVDALEPALDRGA
jgi:NAD(P)-dependent dehydrogenase (short-subunit alcohol dehydrogenase family)